MTLGAANAATALRAGPAVWLWPGAAAVLSAWPIWRSIAPETPDLGQGWFRLEVLAGVALAALYAAWAWPRRRRVHDLAFPFGAILLALHGLVVATRAGDAAGADLCVLMIAWIASTAIFASLALLQVEGAGLAAGCRAPHHGNLLPPVPWLGAICGLVMLAITLLAQIAPGTVLIMAVISPGAVLAWASLSDTARSVLSRRQVHFANAEFLIDLSHLRRWLLRSPTILVSDRVRLVSLYPAADIKPGELVALAAAATVAEESDIARAIQEFGVSHRVRLPAPGRARDGEALAPRQARLANGTLVELCPFDDTLDLAAHRETIALARSQHRKVMAVVERVPDPRVLGAIAFAVGARVGAVEALRVMRDRGHDVMLAAAPRDEADEIVLKSLNVARLDPTSPQHQPAVPVWRGSAGAADAGDGLAVSFGAVQAGAAPPAAQIIVAREDARALTDLARFAEDFRRRTRIVTLLASAPGWVLIAAAFGYLPATPFLVTGVALIGIAVAAVTPQVLRLSPALDMEGAED